LVRGFREFSPWSFGSIDFEPSVRQNIMVGVGVEEAVYPLMARKRRGALIGKDKARRPTDMPSGTCFLQAPLVSFPLNSLFKF
jgi:hypothetical protein